MKKFLALIVLVFTITQLLISSAAAMQVSNPSGTEINGWYKDTFTVDISYGTPVCLGMGNTHDYVFTADNLYNGVHSFKIIGDQADNPYLSVNNNSPQPLVLPPTCPMSTFGTFVIARDLGTIQLDAMSPLVAITNPPGNSTTSSSSYLVSGVASDGESGIENVDLIVNGLTIPAVFSGNSFSATIPLNDGNNTVIAHATDKVGHESLSSPVNITRSSGSTLPPGGTTPGPSPSSSTPPSSSGSTTPSASGGSASTPQTSTTTTTNNDTAALDIGKATNLKFNQQHVLSLSDSTAGKASNPNAVLADAGLGSKTTRSTYLILALLLLIISFIIIWRFRPIFTKLDKHNSGLRRRIIFIVTLPSLIPLFGLGFLGYQQITHNTRATLSNQLAKAAQTSSLKLEREFSIRSEVITKSSSDILQIKAQIQDDRAKLTQQKAACADVVNSAIPKKQYGQVTSSDSCLPFLTGFAQLASSSGASVTNYLNALDQGEKTAEDDLSAQEQQRVNELLGSVRHYFPDLYELTVVGNDPAVTIEAELPPGRSGQPTVLKNNKDLLKQARSDTLTQVLNSNKPRLILLTQPITLNGKTIGGAAAAIDIDQVNFMPDIWRSTPKPYSGDVVYFISSQGDLLYPVSGTKVKAKDLQKMSLTHPGDVYTLSDSSQQLTTRVSQVPGTNLAVAVGAPANSVLAPLAGVQQTALLAIISFILLSIILGVLFVSGIAGEIEKLLTGALNFAKGELTYRIGLKSHDELQTLGDTMDSMAGDIKIAQQALIDKDKEFISVATHELKAPMTAIIGNLSMITEDGMGQIDETARKLIGQAYDGTVRLRSLVTDMLDVARLDAGKAQFTIVPLNIAEETKAIITMQEIPAQQANIGLIFSPQSALPPVLADKTKIEIILTNFVSNAIKYNRPNGTITIANNLVDGMVVTSVTDSGLGIPEDQKSHIFEKFYRVTNEDRKNVPGTGLGMYITKSFIEAMGGKIWFESIHGQGTTFYFSLPIVQPPQTTPPVAP